MTRGELKAARRDAEEVIAEFAFDAPGPAIRTARHCLALLDELEREKQAHLVTIRVAGVHLAKVPGATVEALVRAEQALGDYEGETA